MNKYLLPYPKIMSGNILEIYIKCISCNILYIHWSIIKNCEKTKIPHCSGCHDYHYDDIYIINDKTKRKLHLLRKKN